MAAPRPRPLADADLALPPPLTAEESAARRERLSELNAAIMADRDAEIDPRSEQRKEEARRRKNERRRLSRHQPPLDAEVQPETLHVPVALPAAMPALCAPGCPACLRMNSAIFATGRRGKPHGPAARPQKHRQHPPRTYRLLHIDPSLPPGPLMTEAGAAAWMFLLADHKRPNTVIAELSGVTSAMVGKHRSRLERLGAISVWRGPTSPGQMSAGSAAARAELIRDPAQRNVDIARKAGCSDVMVGIHRRDLERARQEPVELLWSPWVATEKGGGCP